MADIKTYTQDQVDQMVKSKAESSFQAGVVKGKTGSKPTEEFEAMQVELNSYKDKETFNKIVKETSGIYKDNGGRSKGLDLFVKENRTSLEGKTPEEITKFITEQKTSNDLFFDNKDVRTSTLFDQSNNELPTEIEYYPGTTIPKRK